MRENLSKMIFQKQSIYLPRIYHAEKNIGAISFGLRTVHVVKHGKKLVGRKKVLAMMVCGVQTIIMQKTGVKHSLQNEDQTQIDF